MVFYVEHIDCCGTTSGGVTSGDGTRLNPAFEGDVIEAALALRLTTDTIVMYGSYGLTDRLDLGVAVPIISVDVDASIQARIRRLATAANPSLHQFDGDNPDERVFATSGSATGLGDIVVRAKYNFLRGRGGGLAAAVDVRTPTGDESNLLGTGGVQTKVYAIASAAAGKLSPHANVGYTFSSEGALPGASLKDEVNYTVGVDLAVTSRISVIADVLGRSIRDLGRLREADKVFAFVQTGPGGGPVVVVVVVVAAEVAVAVEQERHPHQTVGHGTGASFRAGPSESRNRQCRRQTESDAHAARVGEPAVQSDDCRSSRPRHAGDQRRLRLLTPWRRAPQIGELARIRPLASDMLVCPRPRGETASAIPGAR